MCTVRQEVIDLMPEVGDQPQGAVPHDNRHPRQTRPSAPNVDIGPLLGGKFTVI